jgi:hypothetical protein
VGSELEDEEDTSEMPQKRLYQPVNQAVEFDEESSPTWWNLLVNGLSTILR